MSRPNVSFNKSPVFHFLIPSLILIMLAVVVPVRAAPDFELNVNIPPVVDTAHPSVAIITVTSVYQFTGTVNLSENSTRGLSCNPINPNIITIDSSGGSGTASLSCNTSTPGLYKVTVTGVSGSLTHASMYTANFTATSHSQPPTILGLSLPVFFGTIVGIVAIALVVSYIGIKKGKLQQQRNAPR